MLNFYLKTIAVLRPEEFPLCGSETLSNSLACILKPCSHSLETFNFSAATCQVRDQLFDILEVHASSGAFAAVRADGVVITWGHPLSGGDSRSVRKQLAEGLGEAKRADTSYRD